jgi:hypothetical protein
MDCAANYNGSTNNGSATTAANYCATSTNNGSATTSTNYCAAASATNYGSAASAYNSSSIKPIKLRIPWCFC